MLVKSFADSIMGNCSFSTLCNVEDPGQEPGGGNPNNPGSGDDDQKPSVEPKPEPKPAPKPAPSGDPEWLPARLDRARKNAESKTQNGILSELGMTSMDELKALSEERKAAMSDAQRLELERGQLARKLEEERAANAAEQDRLRKERDDIRKKHSSATKTTQFDKVLDDLQLGTEDAPGVRVASRDATRKLLLEDFDLEEGKLVVKSDPSRSVKEYVSEYLTKNSYLVLTNAKNGGAGSTPSPAAGQPKEGKPDTSTVKGRYEIWKANQPGAKES